MPMRVDDALTMEDFTALVTSFDAAVLAYFGLCRRGLQACEGYLGAGRLPALDCYKKLFVLHLDGIAGLKSTEGWGHLKRLAQNVPGLQELLPSPEGLQEPTEASMLPAEPPPTTPGS